MANKVVLVCVGGSPAEFNEVTTIASIAAKAGLTIKDYTFLLNGRGANAETELKDFDRVDAALAVKGA